MNRSFLICGFAIVLQLMAVASAQTPDEQPKATEIPLDQIWGYNLPGTKDIAGIPLPDGVDKLGQNYSALRSEREKHIESIRRSLSEKAPADRAHPGFVYPRQPDFYTLRAVTSQLLTDSKNRRMRTTMQSFPSDKEFTLMFFSHPTSYYVRLRKIEQKARTFVVHYQFEPHANPEVAVHFAMIPLGTLTSGDYHIEFERMPEDREYRDSGFKLIQDASTIVCDSFSFKVFDPPIEEPQSENATNIPLDDIWAHEMPGTINVRELESKRRPGHPWLLSESPNVMRILEILRDPQTADETAGHAFVVEGLGTEALKNARSVLDASNDRQSTFRPDDDLSLVFYSFVFGRYVHIESVETLNRTISIKYRFVSHSTAESTAHFAIISLGKLPEGEFHVDIEQLPPTSVHGVAVSYVPIPQKYVSESFSFQIQEGETVQ